MSTPIEEQHGGEQWTVKRLTQLWASYGCKHMTDMPTFLQAVVNLHNEGAAHAIEQDDTKRLDWLLRRLGYYTTREAIDAAMRKET